MDSKTKDGSTEKYRTYLACVIPYPSQEQLSTRRDPLGEAHHSGRRAGEPQQAPRGHLQPLLQGSPTILADTDPGWLSSHRVPSSAPTPRSWSCCWDEIRPGGSQEGPGFCCVPGLRCHTQHLPIDDTRAGAAHPVRSVIALWGLWLSLWLTS